MKTKKVSISVFQIFIVVLVIIIIAIGVNIFKGKNKSKKEEKISVEKILEEFQGAGTNEDPYKIDKVEDLVNLARMVNEGNSFENKNFILLNDLDIKNEDSYLDISVKLGDINKDGKIEYIKEELTKENGFEVIGNSKDKIFKGIFNGNKKVIKNLDININRIDSKNNEELVGLFGYNGGTIKSLKVIGNVKINEILENSKIKIGLISAINEGKVDSCTSEGQIEANCDGKNMDIKVGGISAINSGLIKDSVNNVNINSNHTKAGITALNFENKNIENSGSITNCTNSGNIVEEKYSDNYTAGIVAENRYGKIISCNNNGNIKGKIVGGIVGKTTGNIIASKNTGEISNLKIKSDNTEISGGIAAILETSKIENSKNVGNIIGTTNVGGIVGENRGIISKTKNEGKIQRLQEIVCNQVNIGGIAGININKAQIIDSVNFGQVSTNADSIVNLGGIVGILYNDSTIEKCQSNGTLSGEAKEINTNEDLNKKCKQCEAKAGGSATRESFGKLNLGFIYGNFQEI